MVGPLRGGLLSAPFIAWPSCVVTVAIAFGAGAP